MSEVNGRAAAHWFEVPAADFDRAVRFYETVLASPFRREAFGDRTLAIFPHDDPAIGGCIAVGAPSQEGSTVYLNADGMLDEALARVKAAGGAVLTPRTALPPGMGFMAMIRDSEGNRVGLHST